MQLATKPASCPDVETVPARIRLCAYRDDVASVLNSGSRVTASRVTTDSSRARRGLSLFEVVLALSIFIGALAAISQVLRTGSRAAIRAQLHSQAAIYCEQQMNRVLAGIDPLESVSKSTLDGRSDWTWSLDVVDAGLPYLLQLDFSVEHASPNPDAVVKYHLVRLVRDPQAFVDAAAAAADAAAASEEAAL